MGYDLSKNKIGEGIDINTDFDEYLRKQACGKTNQVSRLNF